MFPYINVFGKQIPTYGLCALTGIAFSALLVWVLIRKRKDYSKVHILNIPLFATIGAFFGAHILYALTRPDVLWYILGHMDDLTSSFQRALELLGALFGGMVFYGGLIGGLVSGMLCCKKLKLDFSFYADIYAPAIPLFHAFGRIGCFLAGCCYGIESHFGLMYHNEMYPDASGVTRLPIQLIEAGLNLLLVLVLVLLNKKKLKNGTLLSVYLIVYPIIRFVDEFFRGDAVRGLWFGLSTSQWISMILFVTGVVMLLKRYILPSWKDRYATRVDIGVIPPGYYYNQYSGVLTPEQAKNILYGEVEKGEELPSDKSRSAEA